MTPKELGELGHLEAAVPIVDPADFPPPEADEPLEPGQRKSVALLRGFADLEANKPKRMVFDFFAKPLRIEGDGKAERIIVERTELDESGAARGTGETYEVPGVADHQRDRLFDPADRRTCHSRGGKFLNERRADRRPALCRRLGAARADRDDRHQPARRL